MYELCFNIISQIIVPIVAALIGGGVGYRIGYKVGIKQTTQTAGDNAHQIQVQNIKGNGNQINN